MAIKYPRPSGGRFSLVKNGLFAGAAEVIKSMLIDASFEIQMGVPMPRIILHFVL